jgi:hypothetical protein
MNDHHVVLRGHPAVEGNALHLRAEKPPKALRVTLAASDGSQCEIVFRPRAEFEELDCCMDHLGRCAQVYMPDEGWDS